MQILLMPILAIHTLIMLISPCNFIGANFSGIDFSYNEELTNLNASGANFSGANLNHAVFTGQFKWSYNK